MAFNSIGNGGENPYGRFHYGSLGSAARAAADKLSGLRQKNAAARAETPAAPKDSDATKDEAPIAQNAETEAAAENGDAAAPKGGPRGNKLLNGLMKQVDKLLTRFNAPSASGAPGAARDAAQNAEGTDGASAASPANWLNDFDLGSLGLFDQLGGLEGLRNYDGATLEAGKVQFSLNLSVVQSVATAEGMSQTSLNFSLKMDLSWMRLGMYTGGAADGASPAPAAAPDAAKDAGASAADAAALAQADAKKGKDLSGLVDFLKYLGMGDLAGLGSSASPSAAQSSPMDSFLEYFNPENTANRILGFATAFYPASKFAKDGDTPESRQAFADYIGKAIQKGFDQAQGILGKVDDKTQGGIDETHERVFKGLEDFVKQAGSNASAQERQNAASVRAWQVSVEMSYSYSRTTTTYNANGRTNGNAAAAAAPAVDAEA